MQKYKLHIGLSLVLLIMLFLNSSRSVPVDAQEPGIVSELTVEAVFNTLTPEERVGQLFMVSFNGNDVSVASDIAELIQRYRVGGVYLSPENRNFTNDQSAPAQVLSLTNSLQSLAREKPLVPASGAEEVPVSPVTSTVSSQVPTDTVEIYNPIPLFIAVAHEGDGFPHTEVRSGLPDVPNQMALGATWNAEYVRLVGQTVGQQLSLLGVNMLFGPTLDVLDNPRPEHGGSLGTRTFGGHPFWVGELGRAYIRGIHQGSEGQILTIAKHFPGFGSSDREINQRVPIIAKSLDDLRRTELPPFFKVTQINPEDPQIDREGVTDGLMTAHVRYQGLQGNAPISMDARNLPALLALKEFAPWREGGGLVVSAPLGVPAALEGISVDRNSYPARRLTQDAFVAGSDVLLLVDFAFNENSAQEMANIKNAIQFFQEKYATDPNFQAAVDRSVRRIIRAKVKLYGDDLLRTRIEQPVENLGRLADMALDMEQIARAGATLITPITQEGVTPLPGPPQPGDDILIFTDSRVVKDCPDCPEFVLLETTALERFLLQLFGPEATGQIRPEQITSLSFADLKAAIGEEETVETTGVTAEEEAEVVEPPRTPEDQQAMAENAEAAEQAEEQQEPSETPEEAEQTDVEALIETADWIIFAMLDINREVHPHSDAVRVLLRNHYDALRNKNLVLFAFNAPYFLDETEISQLTAYYGFFSKTSDYLRTAARLLFQQFEPSGASPVAIPAIGRLDLSPDPNQTIQLEPLHKIDLNNNVISLDTQSGPITTLDLKVGEGIRFRTDVIVDKNGNPVPDGTLVDFFRFYPLEGLSLQPLTASTVNGVAEITIVKERDTPLQVTASSNLATQSVPFNIGPGIIDTPTPTPTTTPTPTDTPTPTATATATATPTRVVTPTPDILSPLPTEPPVGPLTTKLNSSSPVDSLDLIYSLLGMFLVGAIAFVLGSDRFSLEERVRPALVAVAVGLIGYIAYTLIAIAFPNAGYMRMLVAEGNSGHWVAPLISLVGAIFGMVIWYLKPGRILWKKTE